MNETDKRTDTKADASANAAPPSPKKGVLIATIALIVIIIVAAIAYNVLAPAAVDDASQITATNTASSGSSNAESTSSDDKSTARNAPNASRENANDADTVAAPDFTVTDSEGASVSLAQFRGKPIVLNFWASTCGPCQREMPEFQKAFETYDDEIQFMMVDIPSFNGESEQRAKNFIASNGYSFPVFFDSANDASVKYGLSSIPRTFFLDAQGNVVASGAGMLDAASLEQGISMLRG